MLYARHINVRADNGVVTLSGYAWTPEEMSAAVQDAERCAGRRPRWSINMEVDRGAISDSSSHSLSVPIRAARMHADEE